ncbi:hypothetical protein AX17_005623, partial [Amanita inopinata Kibby_2008]
HILLAIRTPSNNPIHLTIMRSASLLALALASIAYALPTTEQPSLSDYQTTESNKLGGLLEKRGIAGITLCTNPGFSSCSNYAINTDICYTIPDPYTANLHSSRSSSGRVCFLYTSSDCSDCETCVDESGWSNMN